VTCWGCSKSPASLNCVLTKDPFKKISLTIDRVAVGWANAGSWLGHWLGRWLGQRWAKLQWLLAGPTLALGTPLLLHPLAGPMSAST